jgi:predicted nucleotidyltransferase
VVNKETLNNIINQVVSDLRKRVRISAAFVFGSYAVGTPDKWSDIDLAIFSPDVTDWSIEQKAELSADIKLHCNSNVELHIFSADALIQARPTNFCGHIIETGKKVA